MGDRRVVPYESAHYIEAAGTPQPPDAGQFYAQHPAWTALIDDRVAACAGIIIRWAGVGEAWAIWTPLGQEPRHRRFIHRAVRDGLWRIIAARGLYRVQAQIATACWPARLWAHHLGFTVDEGDMALYGPNRESYTQVVLFPGLSAKEIP